MVTDFMPQVLFAGESVALDYTAVLNAGGVWTVTRADLGAVPATALRQLYERAFCGERAELELEHAQREILLIAAPLEHDSQGVARIVIVAYDLTERQRAAREVTQARQRLLALLECTTDAFFELDSACTVTYINTKALHTLRLTRNDIIGRNLWDVFPEAVGSPFYEHYHHALRTQTPVEFEAYYPPLMTWYEVHAYPTAEGLAVYFRDVNERHQREAALRAANDRALHAQRIARLGDWQWDLASEQMIWSPMVYEILRLDPGQPPPGWEGMRALFVPADGARWQAAVEHTLATGQPYELELRRYPADGALMTLLVRGELVRDSAGKPQILRGFIQDISARKASEEELRRAKEAAQAASRSKSEFLTNMSHELRTPMNGIMAALQLLRETTLSIDQRRYVQIAWDAAEGLLRTMNDILDFSYLDAPQQAHNLTPFAIAPLLNSMPKAFAEPIWRKDLTVRCRVAPEVPPTLNGDAGGLRQVLLRLLDNAVKFTERGSIDLEATLSPPPPECTARWAARVPENEVPPSDTPWLRIAVRDTGSGIAPDQLKRVFEPFQQGDGSLRRRHAGTGLGLSIVQRLVTGMGGWVRLSSTLGEGTVAEILLPWSAPATPPATDRLAAAPPPAELEQQPEKSRLRIVLGEDEAANRILMQRLLQKLGHEVIAVGDGEEVLQQLRVSAADAVLMDLEMPRRDGLQTMRAIREEPDYSHCARTALVAVTGHTMPGERERLLAAGFDDYLPKPVTLAALSALLDRLASRV